jgi:amino acid transporter
MEAERQATPNLEFGTFKGVFTPTLLTILGVIMYVRLPWVVGNAGLLEAWFLMAFAMAITVCTGLSLSSIATNTRVGHGGPYAMISKSLGLEVGGSIGLPLYLTRPLGVAMYVFGFREGWMWVFPNHSALVVDLAVFGLLVGIAYWSSDLAFRVQYGIMAIIVASVVSIFLTQHPMAPSSEITWMGHYPGFPERGFGGTDFWAVFAIFFPATTGILAGANMSGDLRDPRRAIPDGTLWAIGLSTALYFVLAWWASRLGTTEELVTNYTIFIDRAGWGPAVLAGLLGATFSSALAGFVGGPRILLAMGQHGILPRSEWLSRTSSDGEPRNATLLTAILTFGCLMVRDLNAIAPLVTMFFLITYFAINFVLLLETGLGLVSFRPTLKVPMVVPLAGALGCVFAMFIVNPTFGLVAVATVVLIYFWIQRQGVESDNGNVRSSVFSAVAEWAAAQVAGLDSTADVRAWKPKLLIPVEDPAEIRGEFRFLVDACRPEGSVKLLGLATQETVDQLAPRIARVGRAFQSENLFATWTTIDSQDFSHGVTTGLQALQSAFFRPNLMWLGVPDIAERDAEFQNIIATARRTQVGVLLIGMHRKAGFGRSKSISLWVRPHGPEWDPRAAFETYNLNLTILMGFRLLRAWKAELNVVTVVGSEDEVPAARTFLTEVCELARIRKSSRIVVRVGDFEEEIADAPRSDVHIMGLPPEVDFGFTRRMVQLSRASCLFVSDSGRESALA